MTKRLEWRVCAAFCGGAALMLFAVIWWTTGAKSQPAFAQQLHPNRGGRGTGPREPMYHSDYPNPDAKDLPFAELSKQYRIIGRLGIPTGEFCTVRGIWREDGHFKECSLRFHVSHVNGKALTTPAIFLGCEVRAIQDPERETPDGEQWEIRVQESVEQRGMTKDYSKETGWSGSGINPWRLVTELRYVQTPNIKHSVSPN